MRPCPGRTRAQTSDSTLTLAPQLPSTWKEAATKGFKDAITIITACGPSHEEYPINYFIIHIGDVQHMPRVHSEVLTQGSQDDIHRHIGPTTNYIAIKVSFPYFFIV